MEEVAEPFLVREGLLARTPRGRVATPAAWAHLGLTRRGRRVPETDNRTCSGRDGTVTKRTFAGAGTPVPC